MSAETAFGALVWLAALCVCVPMGVVVVEAVAALGYDKRKALQVPTELNPVTVVLIPAHNEEAVIHRSLESVSAGLPPNCRVLCVAHNCSDATADVARRFGAEVIEERDAGGGGKPYALKAGLRWLDANPPDVVVIIDADCVVGEGAIRALATRAQALNRPVMGAYYFANGDADSGVGAISSLAVLLKNFIRPLGLHRMGLPCLLNGSGSAYPFHLISNAPHGEGSIAEDYQLSVDLLRLGYPTNFVPQARVDGMLPKTKKVVMGQRRRWEHGHLQLSFRTPPLLMLEGLMRLDRNRIALALELTVPPLVFLGLMWGAATALSAGYFLAYRKAGPLGLLTLAAVALALAVMASWVRFAGVRQSLAALILAPRYLMWKLPMYRDFFTRRETQWTKTGRD